MKRIRDEIKEVIELESDSQEKLVKAFKGLGYEI
jgi:hypothetical protein